MKKLKILLPLLLLTQVVMSQRKGLSSRDSISNFIEGNTIVMLDSVGGVGSTKILSVRKFKSEYLPEVVANTAKVTFYDGSGSLSGNTTVNMGGNALSFDEDLLINGLTVGKGANPADNTAVGVDVLGSHVGGWDDVGVGWKALRDVVNANGLTAVGTLSQASNINGTGNTSIGAYTLGVNLLSGSTALGAFSANQNLGSNLLCVGYHAGENSSTSGELFFDAYDRVTAAGERSKSIIYGQMNADEALQKLTFNASVSVGGTIEPSSQLTATSTTKGFLPPRMTTVQRDAIGTPATGLQIYNTTDNENNLYDGSAWVAVNVTTNLSEGTATTTTVDINSSDGTNATLLAASTTRAGVMTKAKFDEVVINNAKTISGTTGYIPKFTGSTAVGNSVVYQNGSNIGINTLTPNYLFDIYGLAAGGNIPVLNLHNNSSSVGSAVSMRFSPTTAPLLRYSEIVAINDGVNRIDLAFVTGDGAVITEKVRIKAGGNVGIGIDNPARLLSVSGVTGWNFGLTEMGYFNPTPTGGEFVLRGASSSDIRLDARSGNTSYFNTFNGKFAFGQKMATEVVDVLGKIKVSEGVIFGSGEAELRSIDVTITPAHMAALGTPVQVIPSPGVGYVIVVTGVSAHLTYEGTAYTSNTTLSLKTNGATVAQAEAYALLVSTVNTHRTFELKHVTTIDATATQILPNQPLMLYTAANPGSGNSGAELHITYEIREE